MVIKKVPLSVSGSRGPGNWETIVYPFKTNKVSFRLFCRRKNIRFYIIFVYLLVINFLILIYLLELDYLFR